MTYVMLYCKNNPIYWYRTFNRGLRGYATCPKDDIYVFLKVRRTIL